MAKLLKIDNLKTVKQSNRLIVAKYKLTTYEQRMIIAICSQLDKNAKDFSKVSVKVKDMAEFCNFTGKDSYQRTKATIMKLAARTLQIKTIDGGWYITHWLQAAEYFPQKSIIEYQVDERLKPELLQLKKAYLETPIAPLIKFKSNYSARLYFILKKMLKIKDFEYDLDFFRERFCLGKSYKLFANMKNYVFEPAFKEINEQSDINVEYTYIKEGRAYTKIHFVVTEKNVKKINNPSIKLKKIESLSDDQQSILVRLMNPDRWNLTEDTARKLIKKYNLIAIEKNLQYAYKYRKGKENLGGWLISCIERNEAGKEEERKVLKKQSDKALDKKRVEKMTVLDVNTKESEKKSQLNKIPDFIISLIKQEIRLGKPISPLQKKQLDQFGLTIDDVISNH